MQPIGQRVHKNRSISSSAQEGIIRHVMMKRVNTMNKAALKRVGIICWAQSSQSGFDKSVWNACLDCRGLKSLKTSQICVHLSFKCVSYASKHLKI